MDNYFDFIWWILWKSIYSTHFCTAKHNSWPKFHMVSVKKRTRHQNCKVSFWVTVLLKELLTLPIWVHVTSKLFMQKIVIWLSWDWNYKHFDGPVSAYTEGIGAVLWDVMISEQARSAIRTLYNVINVQVRHIYFHISKD